MATELSKSYYIRYKVKRKNTSGAIVSGTRDLKPAAGISPDTAAAPGQVNTLTNQLQPLITDTIEAFTIVEEREFAPTINAGVVPGEMEYENLENVRLKFNMQTSGGVNLGTLQVNRAATNFTNEQIEAFAYKLEEVVAGEPNVVSADLLGTSDTTVWTAS